MIFTATKQTHTIQIPADSFSIISSANAYKTALLNNIAMAKRRIYITALYFEDDNAGREIFSALIAQKQRYPDLVIKLFVDFHRAQRGLIGDKTSLGNRAFYQSMTEQYGDLIEVYGVAVKRKELFGVLHLKGMIFDDTVLYSGASVNNVYCHQLEHYRADRYHVIENQNLADSMTGFLDTVFVDSNIAPRIDCIETPNKRELLSRIHALKRFLNNCYYSTHATEQGEVSITPVLGFGRRNNQLNNTIGELISQSQQCVVLFTPYFNLPSPILNQVKKALARGVKVTIVIGDKTASDFYIPPTKPFSTIGVIPYIYEQMLRKFIQRKQVFIEQGLLTVRVWKHDSNSFHVKGIMVDNCSHLLTGSNLNPRAWRLDLENGLLLQDPKKLLWPQFEQEINAILQHTRKLESAVTIDATSDYPRKVRRILRRLRVAQIDRFLKRLL